MSGSGLEAQRTVACFPASEEDSTTPVGAETSFTTLTLRSAVWGWEGGENRLRSALVAVIRMT